MASILVHVETRAGRVLPIGFELLAAGRALAAATGGSLEALVCAAAPDEAAAEITAADRVLTVAHPSLSPYLPEAHAAVLADVVGAAPARSGAVRLHQRRPRSRGRRRGAHAAGRCWPIAAPWRWPTGRCRPRRRPMAAS